MAHHDEDFKDDSGFLAILPATIGWVQAFSG